MYYDINPDAVRYFEENGLLIDSIIAAGERRGIDQGRVESAIESIYLQIKAGETIKPISLVSSVVSMAKRMRGKSVALDSERVRAMLERNRELRAQLQRIAKEKDEEWKEIIKIILFCELFAAGMLLSTWRHAATFFGG